MPKPVKLDRVPPTTVTSPMLKSVLASLRAKLMVAVSPVASVVLLLVTMTVGGLVSPAGPGAASAPMLRATALLASAPSWLKLAAASLKVLLATTMAAAVAPGLGVKVAE